jgi:hypothetical protein
MAVTNVSKAGQPPARSVYPDEPERIKLPFRIEDTMVVRSPAAPTRIATCKVVGAVHGRYILITEPAVKINERVSAVLDETLLCSCLCDDYLYIFYSRYRNRLMGDLVCIEYPREVEIRRIREHTRIKVDIETRVSLGNGEPVWASMHDISRGGCRLTFNQRVRMAKGSGIALTFDLPNEIHVERLEAVVAKIKQADGATETGISFISKAREISKILDFCEICRFV